MFSVLLLIVIYSAYAYASPVYAIIGAEGATYPCNTSTAYATEVYSSCVLMNLTCQCIDVRGETIVVVIYASEKKFDPMVIAWSLMFVGSAAAGFLYFFFGRTIVPSAVPSPIGGLTF